MFISVLLSTRFATTNKFLYFLNKFSYFILNANFSYLCIFLLMSENGIAHQEDNVALGRYSNNVVREITCLQNARQVALKLNKDVSFMQVQCSDSKPKDSVGTMFSSPLKYLILSNINCARFENIQQRNPPNGNKSSTSNIKDKMFSQLIIQKTYVNY